MPPLEPLPGQPAAVGGAPGPGQPGTEPAAKDLVTVGGRHELEKARSDLVRRISARSDDFEATAALSAVNRALAVLGWDDSYSWKHRRKP